MHKTWFENMYGGTRKHECLVSYIVMVVDVFVTCLLGVGNALDLDVWHRCRLLRRWVERRNGPARSWLRRCYVHGLSHCCRWASWIW